MLVKQVGVCEPRNLPLGNLELPATGTLDLWLLDIDSAEMSFSTSPAAIDRKAKTRQRKFAQQFYCRLLLSTYLQKPPASLKISRSAQGKPILEPVDNPPLHFNISHSRNWLAIAISTEQPLGVDIECKRLNTNPLALAERYFCESEIKWLQASDNIQIAFNQLWVRKEAALKCLGLGIAGRLTNTQCSLIEPTATDQVFLSQLPAGYTSTNKLEIIHWQADELGIQGAIALPELPTTINSFQLSCTRR